jgi:hypothetical protein
MDTGVVAELESAEALVRVAAEMRKRGYRNLDAFTPYPVKGLAEALSLPRSPLTWKVLPLAVLGAVMGFGIQWFCNGIDYPLNVGGRPLLSAPAWIPITFETTVLFSSIFGVIIGLSLMGLPRLYRPLFDVPDFERATSDRFFLGVDAADPSYSEIQAERDLRELGVHRISVARRRERS